ncbi:hypothetical protein ACOME3_002191 [Neoechinorhynchus agilis]
MVYRTFLLPTKMNLVSLRSMNTVDFDSSKELFALVVRHGISRETTARKRGQRDSLGTADDLQEFKPVSKLSRRQRMSLPTIPPPEYISQMFQKKICQENCTAQRSRKRKWRVPKEPEHQIIDNENKENVGPKGKKRKRNIDAPVLSSTLHNCVPVKKKKKSNEIEQIDFNLIGTLHSDRNYRCWRCPKCRRRSLEDMDHQRGQCGYRSCGISYCTLCFSDYHPFSPCIQPLESKPKKTVSKGRIRRC